MDRSEWGTVGTLPLLKQWTRDVRRHERIIRAVWWRDPMGKILGLRRAALQERLRRCMAELGCRYQGVLYEILETEGVPEERLTDSQIKVWQMTQAQVRRNPVPWRVPGLLWASCVSLGVREDALPMRLKRKLMLRAFIEEIPDSPQRRVLLRLAYEHQGEAFQSLDTDEGVLGRVSQAYPLLHKQLLRSSRRLANWSDGALLPGDLAAMTSPYSDFDEWLFELDEPPGENHVF